MLTDTVDFECVNERNQFDKESPARAEAAVRVGLGVRVRVGLRPPSG